MFLTPNTTLSATPPYLTPDVVPRGRASPASPSSPEDSSFAMPTYFDQKRRAVSAMAAVQPLANFQVFKQKSLTTIPALVEKHRRAEELFTNFPFLTPLAHRKNSLVSHHLEDEFYCIPSEAEAGEGGGAGEAGEDVRRRLPAAASTPRDPARSAPPPTTTATTAATAACH